MVFGALRLPVNSVARHLPASYSPGWSVWNDPRSARECCLDTKTLAAWLRVKGAPRGLSVEGSRYCGPGLFSSSRGVLGRCGLLPKCGLPVARSTEEGDRDLGTVGEEAEPGCERLAEYDEHATQAGSALPPSAAQHRSTHAVPHL